MMRYLAIKSGKHPLDDEVENMPARNVETS